MKEIKLLAVVVLSACLAAPLTAFAEKTSENEDVRDEMERQISAIDLSPWEEYLDDLCRLNIDDALSLEEFLLCFSESDRFENASALYNYIVAVIKLEMKKALPHIAALVAAALITSLACAASDGIGKTLSVVLGISAITLSVAMLASLAERAYAAINEAEVLSEKIVPVMSTVMLATGSETMASLFQPTMLFLSGTVTALFKRLVMPLVLAEGVLSAVNAAADGIKLEGTVKLIKSVVKTVVGLVSVYYFGVIAVQGINAASHDGVTVRTAKYALDKLVPSTGGMVSGTFDSILGCALLIKNGAGTIAILIILSRLIKPLIVLLAGVFIFKTAAAVSSCAADGRIVKQYGSMADTIYGMFSCVAVTCAMLMLSLMIVIASGGLTAGLW